MDKISKTKPGRARRLGGALVLGGVLALWAVALLDLTANGAWRPPAPTTGFAPIELHPEGDFAHPTGFAMPERVGPFERAAVMQFDREGRDISAGYNAVVGTEPPLPIFATVYVYPARPGENLEAQFESVLDGLASRHRGARPEFHKNILLAEGRFAGRYAVFGYAEPWGGVEQDVPLRSYLVVYRWGSWWVKWRATTPAPVDDERMKAIVDLTETLLPPEADAHETRPLAKAVGTGREASE